MTIASTLSVQRFPCNGVATQFAFSNKIFAASDLIVTLIDTLGNLYSFTNFANAGTGLSYSVQGVDVDTGCTLVFSAAPTNLWTLDVRSSTPETQSTSIKNQGAFLPELHEEAFDRLTRELQDLLRMTYTYGIHGPDIESTPWPALPGPTVRAGAGLVFDNSGLPTLGVLASTVVTGPIIANLLNLVTTIAPTADKIRTPAEIAASVTPVNFAYAPGNLLRYGLVANSAGAGAANLAALKALFNPAFANGPTGQFTFPNTTGADVYTIGAAGASCVIPMRDGCRLDLQQCTLSFVGTGSAPDSNSGCFFAIRDTEFRNGNVTVTWATGVSSSSGNAFQFGARGTDSSYFGGVSSPYPTGVWDSLLAVPQRNCRLQKVNITINASGANLASVGAVVFVGGRTGDELDITINGSGTLTQGVVQEFGWATNEAQPSARQSSHMRNWRFNVVVSNMDNVNAGSGGIIFAGAYQGVLENYIFSGVSNGLLSSTGESMFYRPWAGVDDIAGKHAITLRNITGSNFSASGLTLSGSQARAANSGYLQRAWAINTAYGIRETVINAGNMYVCTVGGTSAGAGGPTTQANGIVDNTVTWNYVPLTANTDQLDYVLDGNINLNGAATAAGIASSAGYLSIKGSCTITGCLNPVFLFAECTRFTAEGLRASGGQGTGLEAATTAGQIWPTVRKKSLTIRDGYIYGNSVASAGASAGININNCVSALIENNRINLDANYGGVAETTQGNGVQVGANAFGVICRSNDVGNIVGGGNAAYASIAGTGVLNGNDVVSPKGTVTLFGPWNNDGTGNATTTNLGSAAANINTVGKYFGRRCFNSSNNRLLIALGPNTTDLWAYCDGNAPGSITPA